MTKWPPLLMVRRECKSVPDLRLLLNLMTPLLRSQLPHADTQAPPTATTGANQAPATRRLADATPTNAGAPVSSDNSTKNATNDDWKKLPSEKDKMRVQINKKMFDKGMPFHGIKAFTVVFNAHEKDYVKEFPVC